MAVLNLRSVPDELYKRLKVAAAEAGLPFHKFCMDLMRGALDDTEWTRRRPKVTVHPPIEVDLPPCAAPKAADTRFVPVIRTVNLEMGAGRSFQYDASGPPDERSESVSHDIEIT